MRTSSSYSESPLVQIDSVREQMPITEALNLLKSVKDGWNINSILLTELKWAETRLLQMQQVWISYISGALLVMLKDLEKSGPIRLSGITHAFTLPANDEKAAF